ncbi:MAG: hypothetical protein QXN05_02700 [Acidilobaceae archaeon]
MSSESSPPKGSNDRVKMLGLSKRFVLLDPDLGLWAFIGRSSDYIIIEGLYCSCFEFLKHLKERSCVHLRALEIAKSSERYKRLEANREDVAKIVWEVLTLGQSPKLRSLTYS